jgi:hypothetical protein
LATVAHGEEFSTFPYAIHSDVLEKSRIGAFFCNSCNKLWTNSVTKLASGAIFHAYHFESGLLNLEQVDTTEMLFGK